MKTDKVSLFFAAGRFCVTSSCVRVSKFSVLESSLYAEHALLAQRSSYDSSEGSVL